MGGERREGDGRGVGILLKVKGSLLLRG